MIQEFTDILPTLFIKTTEWYKKAANGNASLKPEQ